MIADAIGFPSYPARPVNGGQLPLAMPKIGDWIYEPKGNGRRAVIDGATGKIWNRHGHPSSLWPGESTHPHLFDKALGELMRLFPEHYVDVEILYGRTVYGTGTIVVLDLMVPNLAYQHRRIDIESKVRWIQLESIPEYELVCFPTCSCAKTLWKLAFDANWAFNLPNGSPMWEGIVAKQTDSLYPLQLISPHREFGGWMKHRYAW